MKQVIALFMLVHLFSIIYGQEKSLTNLGLKDAIELGLKNNPEIQSARQRISSAKGRFWSGISLPQPEISTQHEWAPIGKSLKGATERTIEIGQSFEFPSNYFLKGSKFNSEEEIEVYRLSMAERNIIYQIKTNYYKVLTKQFQIKSAEENLLISEDFLKKAEVKRSVGEGTNLERLTAKVQYTESKNNLEVIKNELTIAFAELNYALGFGKQSYSSNQSLTDSMVFVDHNISLDKLYQIMESTNPQIKIAELNSQISSVENSLAWSSLLPNFNVAYYQQTRDGNNGFYGAALGVSIPLWFLLDQNGKIQESAAKQAISESEQRVTKNEISLMLKNAFTDHENNLQQVKLYVNDILPQAEEIYRTAIKSYDAGELTYLEYLQAKQTLISSRNNYINALFNHFQSVFKIEEMIGKNITDNSGLEN